MEIPSIDTMLAAWRTLLRGLTAESTPSGMDTASASSNAAHINSRLGQTRSAMTPDTSRAYLYECPQSPLTRPSNQWPYWTGKGSFKPSRC
jgi:hypothetical protein